MRRSLSPLLAALFALLPNGASAQEPRPSGGARGPARNQIAVEIGFLSAGLSYARRIGATPWSAGAGVWGAWEPPHTFDRSVLEPIGAVVFGRYRPAPWLHADVGLATARYLWADDCSECTGTFVGVRTAALIGHRIVFVGPELSVGRVRDARHGSDLGAMWGAQVRLVRGWGR
jgi:hypothetical protein